MFFSEFLKEDADINASDIDLVMQKDPDTEEGIEMLADEVEKAMTTSALESVTFFKGGDDALNTFMEASNLETLLEARKISKRTIIRLGKVDDFQRRKHLASLVLAKNANDPLFTKLARNRIMERKLRAQISKKYEAKATKVAKISQKKHIKAMKSMPAMPSIQQQMNMAPNK